MNQLTILDKQQKIRISSKIPPSGDWAKRALNAQGDLIASAVAFIHSQSSHARADIDAIDKYLVKMHYDFTRQQIRAGAENAVERGLLDKRGISVEYFPKVKK